MIDNKTSSWNALLVVLVLLGATVIFAQSLPTEFGALDDGRQFVDVPRDASAKSAVERGAMAAALGDGATSERLLRNVVSREPRSLAAHQAYELLSRLYLRSGQYERGFRNLEEWGRVFPDSVALREERRDFEVFTGLPNQRNGRQRMSALTHEEGDDFSVPLTLNGKPSRYLLDTGAWASIMTAGEAKRLGLTVRAATGSIGDASGRGARVRRTVVKDLSVGAMQFRDVSFLVLESEEPAGILGMPIILAIGHIQWAAQGGWILGGPSDKNPAASNIVFYKNRLLLASSVFEARVFGTLDTGATTTDLNSNFAQQFGSSIKGRTTPSTQTIEGVGGASVFEGVTVPEVTFEVAGTPLVLRPARVTFQLNAGIGGECCIGNIGRDLLTLTGKLDFDFSTMVLKVE